MKLTRLSLSNPVAVISAILMVFLFGVIALYRIPVQMIPNVERPIIQINTGWRAAAPEEVESEILEPQEDALRGVPGVEKLESSASRGRASITLTFLPGVDLQRSLIEVMNRLNRVPRYPADVTEPLIYAGRDQFGSAIAWFAIKPVEGNPREIASYEEFVEDVVKERIERVPGVANSDVYGGRGREVRITFDPYKAAAHGIDLTQMAALAGNVKDASAGVQDVGRRAYTIRYAGKPSLEEFGDMVLAWNAGSPVRLRDVATVSTALVDARGILAQNGGPSIAFNTQPEEGVNVIEVMDDLKVAIAELQEGPVARAGLEITQVYDETVYIEQSISMLRNNLLIGIALAIGVLWWFMRKFRATAIVALTIPISLFAAFAILEATGRTLNIISLAGLAFAMGMVLDAAIVVLENIVRLREKGVPSEQAANQGATQVWTALLASTLTTVAIFLPIMFLQDISGQLFADLALAISIAIVASLIIALTIIPTAASIWLRGVEMTDRHKHWWDNGTKLIMHLTDTPKKRYAWIGGLIATCATLTVLLLPRADYLPDGKQNWVFAFILPPPGQSMTSAKSEFIDVINERLMPHLVDSDSDVEPKIQNYFVGVFGRFGFMGTRMADPNELDDMLNVLNAKVLQGFPDTLAFANRASIFGRLTGGRSIEMNVQSSNIDAILGATMAGMGAAMQALPGAQVRPVPGVQLAEPELRFSPDERRITEAGFTRQQIAAVIQAMGQGLYVGDYFDGNRRLDIIVRTTPWTSPEELAAIPLYTPNAGIQQLGELVRMERTAGPDQIRRVDRRRTVTLNITPPRNMSLEETIEILQEQVEPAIRGLLPDDGDVTYYGSADQLQTALTNMAQSFSLAIMILFLLMAALFRSFKDSALVLLALPLATVGGVIALRVANLFTFQPMDLLTMIGFITLLGLVVNNAILLVHQTRSAEREGLPRREAVEQGVRIRLRPILMSTMTSLFGMLPLLLIPGAGTELYRGLAAVIVGGMSISTVFTLILLPSLLRLGEAAQQPVPAGLAGAQGQYAQRILDR